MPKITEYAVPSNAAKLRPSPDSYAAFETAARRIGPLLNQASQDYREIGRTEAAGIRAQDFPLDFAAFGEPKTILQGGSGGSARGGGGGGGRAQNARYPSVRGNGGGGSQAGEPVAAAAKLIDGWGQNTGDVAPGVSVLRGGRQPVSGDNNSVITMHPGNTPANDFSTPPDNYLPHQVETYGVAPGVPLPPPDGYTAAPAPAAPDTSSGFWSGLGDAVSSAVSTAGAADYGAYTEGGF